MWFQIELPEAATVTELQFNSAGGGFGGGGGGRGGRGRSPALAQVQVPERRRLP